MSVYDLFIEEVERLAIPADMPAAAVVGELTRAARRAQAAYDMSSPPWCSNHGCRRRWDLEQPHTCSQQPVELPHHWPTDENGVKYHSTHCWCYLEGSAGATDG